MYTQVGWACGRKDTGNNHSYWDFANRPTASLALPHVFEPPPPSPAAERGERRGGEGGGCQRDGAGEGGGGGDREYWDYANRPARK